MPKPSRGAGGWTLGSLAVTLLVGSVAGWLVWSGRGASGLFPFRMSTPQQGTQAASAYEHGRWDEAATRAREQLKTDRNDPEATRTLARALVRLGRDASAMALYTRVVPEARKAEDEYLLGLVLGRDSKVGEATASWERALRLDPEHAEALEGLSQLYASQRRLERATDLAGRLARRPGWESRGLRMLGVLLAEMNDPAGAVIALREAQKRGNDPGEGSSRQAVDLRKLLARSLLQTGRPAEARDTLGLRSSSSPTPDREAAWLLSRAYLQLKEKTEASEALALAGPYRAEHPLENGPSPYLGEVECARCHQAIAQATRGHRHAETFHRGEALTSLPFPDAPVPDPGDPSIVHAVTREGANLGVETRVDQTTYRLVIDYAFGTTDRYITMVGHDAQGVHRASRLSFHHNGADIGWDVSSGDVVHPGRRDGYLGKPVDAPYGIVRCLACHTTNVRFGKERTGPETADRGIGCERCHGPGGAHVAAVELAFPDLAIVNPARATAKATSESLCASCHNLNDGLFERTTPRDDPGWVRSPGKTLTWSRCYSATDGVFGCLTCHDAHHASESSTSSYEKKCLACHDSPSLKNIPAEDHEALSAPSNLACPVNSRSGCVECHMPRVRIPLLHTSLTDHYIRVRKDKSSQTSE